MKKLFFILSILFISSCATQAPALPNPTTSPVVPATQKVTSKSELSLPVAEYGQRLTYKSFGEYSNDRFVGYHVADDIEFTDTMATIPVFAITDGTVDFIGTVSGYGGVIRTTHTIEGKTIHAIYGHIALRSTQLKAGDHIIQGQTLAVLGQGNSAETDGERHHLHFGLYAGNEARINGYEQNASAVKNWINPSDFFLQHGVAIHHTARQFDPHTELGGKDIQLHFSIQADWEVEYIPSLQAINVFTLTGNGTARERSQMLIRYFDADRFQTLNTVNVLSNQDTTVGIHMYPAKRYEIEKKTTVANFPEQPSWRNQKHIVTDFHAHSGFERYYVVAKNPDLTEEQYQNFLATIVQITSTTE